MAENNYLTQSEAKLREIFEKQDLSLLLDFMKKSLTESYKNGISRGKKEAAAKAAEKGSASKQ